MATGSRDRMKEKSETKCQDIGHVKITLLIGRPEIHTPESKTKDKHNSLTSILINGYFQVFIDL